MADVLLRNVVKRYGNYEAVRGISLEIPDSKFVALVGPSGCGKTTTLRMIAGLEDISEGDICIGGRVINDVAPKNRDIAMVFQSYALYPHMTVFQNMAFGLRMRGMAKAEIRKNVEDAARILDISELLGRRPKALSGGQRQRAAMGRAIVRNPKVFLFDEPLSNLDAKLRVQMRTEIKRVHQQVKTTTIYVTHDQIEAMTLADTVVVMNRGRIEQSGTPHELYHAPKTRFVAGFMGSAGKPLIFGLRPEHITEPRGSERGTFSEFSTILDVVEPMGTETMVFFKLGGEAVSGRIDSGMSTPATGEKVRLVANMAHMHLIDPATDAVI
jgi:multiple sugar transport system ATP-binding protein